MSNAMANHTQLPSPAAPSEWWRWPLLPFAAILGATVGTFLLVLFQWFGMKLSGGYSEDGWYFLYILPVMSSALFGHLYVLIALNVAPRGKVISAVVMTTLLGVLSALSVLLAWANPGNATATAAQSTVGAIALVFTAIATIVSKKDEYPG